MKISKLILFIILLTLLNSCKSDNQAVSNLETKIEELNQKLDELETKINEAPTNNNLSVKNGFLRYNEKVPDKSYWDITTISNSVSFAYHRKNETEMWQPIPNAYSSSSGSGYIRISQNDAYDLNGEEYLVVSIKID